MISKEKFIELNHRQQHNFLIKVLSQVEDKNIISNLRQLFKVVRKPSTEMLLTIYEIITGILDYSKNKDDTRKQKQLSLIQQKLRSMKDREHHERQDIQKDLEELLAGLD